MKAEQHMFSNDTILPKDIHQVCTARPGKVVALQHMSCNVHLKFAPLRAALKVYAVSDTTMAAVSARASITTSGW